MKRILHFLIFAVLFFGGARVTNAQTQTTVTATVTDPNGIPYAGGTVKAQINPPGPPSPCVVTGGNCVPIQGTVGPQPLDFTGSFTMNLYPNASITPAATNWIFTVCISPGVQPPLGTGPQCFSVPVTIAGSSQNISATLNGSALSLSFVNTFSTLVPHTWGPGVAGVGALQTFTHPTGGANNQYGEILLEGDPALTFDRDLFSVCGTDGVTPCLGTFNIGEDNDANIVMSWNITTAVVGAQSEGKPFLIYSPTVFAGPVAEWQPQTLSNSCIFFNSCKNGNFFLAAISSTGTMACISNWDSVGHAILASCQPNTVYNAAGAIQNSEGTHIVQDTATLAAGTVTVTLTAPAAFASATSYTCTANDQTATAAVRVTQTSGTSVTFTGSGNDVVRFNCIGN